MNVLSLFDGISCGMIALERAGISVNNYYASEIDKHAIAVSRANYSEIVQLGDVLKWRGWDIDWSTIDLLIGGSPCQGFSFCGKQLNFEDERSKLFFVYNDILHHIQKFNPNIKFLLENVGMKREYQNVISGSLGCNPIEIDSVLLTPMRRKRLYWTNIPYSHIAPNTNNLQDVLETEVQDKYFLSEQQQEKITYKKNGLLYIRNLPKRDMQLNAYDGVVLSRTWQLYMPVIKQTSHCIRSANPDDVGVVVPLNNELRLRKFTLTEMERLQTLPENYTKVDGVTERQAKMCIGNGWTVDVIAEIFKGLSTSAY